MIVHFIKDLPFDSDYWASEELHWCEIEAIERLGVDEIWYWYGAGENEGSGELLMRKGERYDLYNMGHCSCHGPIRKDALSFMPHDLENLKQVCSERYFMGCAPLFEAAEKPKN